MKKTILKLLVMPLAFLFHIGAGKCRLYAHHADYTDFSNPARPPKTKL
jgi:hypothetical protein